MESAFRDGTIRRKLPAVTEIAIPSPHVRLFRPVDQTCMSIPVRGSLTGVSSARRHGLRAVTVPV